MTATRSAAPVRRLHRVCRTDALAIERESMEVRFDPNLVACGLVSWPVLQGHDRISIDKELTYSIILFK
jgi:hypothetical protein